MAPVYNGDVIEVVIKGLLLGQLYMNRFHVSGPYNGGVKVAPTPQTMAGLVSVVATWLENVLGPLLSSEMSFIEVAARQLMAEGGLTAVQQVNSGGTEEAGSAPGNVALCVSLVGATAGKSARGRLYQGGIPTTAIDGNLVSGAFAAGLQAAWNELKVLLENEFGDPEHRMVVYSTRFQGADRFTGVATPVASVAVRDLVVDSQRRRLPGRGR